MSESILMEPSLHHRLSRDAVVADIFYPGNASILKEQVTALLRGCPPPGTAEAIVSPHGSFEISGSLMAQAWQAASGRKSIDTVIILGPLHRPEEEALYLTESWAFDTPAGKIEVDRPSVEELYDCATGFVIDDIPHLMEHSIEVQLPFMSALFPHARLVPILMGKPSLRNMNILARSLSVVFGGRRDRTLTVISSTLASSTRIDYAEAKAARVLELIRERDWEGILDASAQDEHPCGLPCLSAWLVSTLAAGTRPRILATSDTTSIEEYQGEYTATYAAIAMESVIPGR